MKSSFEYVCLNDIDCSQVFKSSKEETECIFCRSIFIEETSMSIINRVCNSSNKFTPECMLGVETTLGYITTIINEGVVMLSRNNVCWYNLNLLKYYISDDNDETVTFDEYIKLFYDVEGVL